MRALEPIYAALFAKAQAANTVATPFTLMSRRWIAWDQMAAEQSPAFFQRQGEVSAVGGTRNLLKFELSVEWYIYLSTDPADHLSPTSPALNNYITALVNALLPTVQNASQTLGGLVENAYIDGKIILDEGFISSPAVAMIPITILTGL